MDLEQPGGVGGRLVALRYHLADFNLLLRRQLRTASADAALFAGGIQSGLCPFFAYCPFELGERPDGIGNRINNAIPCCNVRSPANQLLSDCCETGRLCTLQNLW